MSHFSVMVVGDDPVAQLAPYQENNMSDCPLEYMEFEDADNEENRNEYETGTASEFYDASSCSWGCVVHERLFSEIKVHGVGEKFEVSFSKQDLDGLVSYFKKGDAYHVGLYNNNRCPKERVWVRVTEVISTTHPNPNTCFEGRVQLQVIDPPKEIPLKDKYDSFEEYLEQYHGYRKDERTGAYGRWYNPNSKWDWYELGGRWTGYFKLKPGRKGQVGSPSLMSNRKCKPGYADSALKGDIDIEAMEDEAGQRAASTYDSLAAAFGGEIPTIEHLWKDILEGDAYKNLDIADKRDLYWGQEANKGLKNLQSRRDSLPADQKKAVDCTIWGGMEDFQRGRDEYIQRARNSALPSFALIKDGKWYEKGEMGWWGIVSDEKDQGEWTNRFTTLINDLPDDTLLSIFDCHI